MRETILKGHKVTLQPRRWYSGAPVLDWPDPQYVGTVYGFRSAYGITYACVRYPTGRKALENLDNLTVVSPNILPSGDRQ